MEHLDREEEEDDGEANANAKNKVISSLLKGPKQQRNNHHNNAAPVETSDEDSEDDSPPAVRICLWIQVIKNIYVTPLKNVFCFFFLPQSGSQEKAGIQPRIWVKRMNQWRLWTSLLPSVPNTKTDHRLPRLWRKTELATVYTG